MKWNRQKELLKLEPKTHLKLIPVKNNRTPNMDTDIIFEEVVHDDIWNEPVIVYGVSETCDGYVLPLSWIEDFEIIP